VFAWLGGSQYVPVEAIEHTLATVAAHAAPGSVLVFDIKLPVEALPAEEREWIEQTMRRAARRDEPWLGMIAPQAAREMLARHGFVAVDVFDAPVCHARYLEGRADGLQFPAYMQILRATVGPRR